MGQTVREDLTMGKMNMSFEEFMEKMYGGGKLTEPTREELEEVGRVMQEAARRMKEEGVQPLPPGHVDV